MALVINPFFHSATGTYAYLVADESSRDAVIIDPVLDFDPASGRVETLFADALLAEVHQRRLAVGWILETHVHADHLTAAAYLRAELPGARVGVGAGVTAVQSHFRGVFNLGADFPADGQQFDRLFADGERVDAGRLEIEVLATPGHTDDGVSYRIGDAVFVGDTLFAPDVGTARCDFPGGDAGRLYDSLQRLLALPPATRMFLCHDYPPGGREPMAETTVAAQRERNQHLIGRDRAAYVAFREQRDAGLAAPRLLLPALQVNLRGGRLPPAEDNGTTYLKLPLVGAPEAIA